MTKLKDIPIGSLFRLHPDAGPSVLQSVFVRTELFNENFGKEIAFVIGDMNPAEFTPGHDYINPECPVIPVKQVRPGLYSDLDEPAYVETDSAELERKLHYVRDQLLAIRSILEEPDPQLEPDATFHELSPKEIAHFQIERLLKIL